jgi:hypothetical protein
MNRFDGYGNRALAVSMSLLNILLWPVTQLEVRLGADKTAQKFGPIPIKHQALAHVERWGLMSLGVLSAVSMAFRSLTLWIPVGFLITAVVDPFYWSWKFKTPIVAKEDFKLGLVVNLAPIWMFLIGYSIGVVIP